jgi:hypothetical protein
VFRSRLVRASKPDFGGTYPPLPIEVLKSRKQRIKVSPKSRPWLHCFWGSGFCGGAVAGGFAAFVPRGLGGEEEFARRAFEHAAASLESVLANWISASMAFPISALIFLAETSRCRLRTIQEIEERDHPINRAYRSLAMSRFLSWPMRSMLHWGTLCVKHHKILNGECFIRFSGRGTKLLCSLFQPLPTRSEAIKMCPAVRGPKTR